ncbi:MAG: ATP-dependent DNA helicase RecG [Candidatus Pacebacteria bacterium]|nr:ATP-dependent DNA helicase RecG [Candidatus Paceibacterota bacterium]
MNLGDKLEKNFRLDIEQKKALAKLELFTVSDLLFYFPIRYSDMSEVKNISDLVGGESATIYAKISKLQTKKGFKSKIPMGEGYAEDLTGKIKIIWFNQPYLAKMIRDGDNVKLTGKIMQNKAGIYLANPEIERTPNLSIDKHDTLFNSGEKDFGLSYPIYRETRGITSKWFYHAIEKIIKEKTLDNLEDYIPKSILEKYNLPSLKTALIWIHIPKDKNDRDIARKRFAFEEVFFIQLERQKARLEYKDHKAFQINIKEQEIKKFLSNFPFSPTNSQKEAINIILNDLEKDYPMSRLLEGDVGSGKTLVAGAISYATINERPINKELNKKQDFGNLQVAYMVPTEILATQHFESFIKYFENLGINIGLITGKTCRKFPSKTNPKTWTDISRTQLLKWVANGEIPILIGTHTLIQKSVKFKHLALVIIDEQHRFGTKQRRELVKKDDIYPHLLSMTATPIPRTLALTIYGDLDLSLLSEMPSGRKPIITEIITPNKREKTYEEIRKELKNGRQLYIICPRIDTSEDDKIEMKSVTEEAKRLKKEVFKEHNIDILHSKMTKQKKEEIMLNFHSKKIDILVATSVVEVGVNVPNATMIIIEGAERFGLSQLHQLRGRVIRGTHQAYCYVFADAKSQKTIDRLNALKTAKNGFELSELDLTLRGAGELSGGKQWGITDLGMEAIKNIKMVSAARTEALEIINKDRELKDYPILKQKVKEKNQNIHFE